MRRYIALPVLALAGILFTAAPAAANHNHVHTCEQAAPPGGSATFIPNGPGPNDDQCVVRSAPVRTVVPLGAPTVEVSDPRPVGQPIVVTQDVVANCERVNNPNAAKPVEKCDTQRVTTTTQRTEITTTTTQRMQERTVVVVTRFGYLNASPAAPLVVQSVNEEVTTREVAPDVRIVTTPGPPIVDVDTETTGTCTRNPGSDKRNNACPA